MDRARVFSLDDDLLSGQFKNRHSLIRQKDTVPDDFAFLPTTQRRNPLARGTDVPILLASIRTDAI